MGLMTAALLTMGAAQGANQIAGGIYADREAAASSDLMQANAARLSQQAGIVEQMKQLQATRDDRLIRTMMGKSVAVTAAKGIELSGSPAAIMVDTQTQLEMDKAIGQYNYDVEKRRVMTQSKVTSIKAGAVRAGGKAARAAGLASGLTTFGKSAVSAAIASSGFDSKEKYVNIRGKKTLVAPNDYYLR